MTGPPLASIAQLYRIKADAGGRTRLPVVRCGKFQAKPILDAWWAWIQTGRPTIAHGSGIEKALDYAIRRWPALPRYLDDGRDPIDNNPVENIIRPIALGRRNRFFAGSPYAGQRAAAKQNGHQAYAWLKDVLTRQPTHLNSRLHEPLPHSWQPIA